MPPSKGAGRLACAAFLVAALLTPQVVIAQISTATLQGKVSDDSGVLPGARVTAREVQSGFTQESTTDSHGAFTLAGLRPGTLRDHVAISAIQAAVEDRRGAGRPDRHARFPHQPDVVYTETVRSSANGWSTRARRRSPPTSPRSRCAICRRTPATSSTSPRSRPACASPTTSSARRSRRARCRRAAQRLHRRRQLQERRHRGRRGRPGREPRQSVPAERRAGVPGADAELQGGVREGGERDHHRGDQERRQPLHRRHLQPLSGQEPGRRTRPIVRDAAGSLRQGRDRRRSRPTSAGSGARRWAGRSSRTARSSSASYEENRQDRAAIWSRWDGLGAPPALMQRLLRFEGVFTEPVPREAALQQDCRRSRARDSSSR